MKIDDNASFSTSPRHISHPVLPIEDNGEEPEVELVLDNVYLKVNNMTKSQMYNLWTKLSFPIEEFGTQEVRYRYLFNRKTKKTYAGLLQDVVQYCKECKIPFKIINTRKKPEPDADYSLVKEIDGNPLKIRDYQQDVIDRCGPREVIQVATGGGKTVIMAALIDKFKISPVCVFADKISLCVQLKQEFQKFLGREIGFIGDGVYDPKDITVMSIQSADLDIAKQANAIFFDECLREDALILLSNGEYIPIKEIYDRMSKGESFDVISYNTTKKIFESKSVINYSKIPIGKRKLCKIFLKLPDESVKILICTNNHKIWVESRKEYIQADCVLYNEELLTTIVKKQNDYVAIHTELGRVYDFQYIHDSTEYVYDLTVADNHNFVTNDILVSNCHHVPANTFLKVAIECKNAYYRIGVSATPWRDDGSEMLIDALLAKRDQSKAINASKLIQLGYLIKPYIYFVPIKGRYSGKNYAKLYEQAIVDNMNRNKIICKIAYQMYKRNRTILLLIKYVRHGEFLLEKLYNILGKTETKFIYNDNGIESEETVANIEFLSGDASTYRRNVVLAGIDKGYCKLCISSSVFDEGIDSPRLDTLILAGGGKSSTRAYQRIGRVMRLYPGKTKCFVFDFDDETPIFHRHAKHRKKLYEEEEEFEINEFEVTV